VKASGVWQAVWLDIVDEASKAPLQPMNQLVNRTGRFATIEYPTTDILLGTGLPFGVSQVEVRLGWLAMFNALLPASIADCRLISVHSVHLPTCRF